MEHVSGKIMRGQKLLYPNVGMWIDVHEHGVLKSWNGGFTLPTGTYVELGETYRVHLADGRKGEMFIKKVSVDRQKPTSVLFQGSGPLAR